MTSCEMITSNPTTEQRNDIFMEYRGLIKYIIRKNITLIKALRLDLEDVSQDLAVGALKAIESYDSTRGMSIKSFIIYKLQFEILAIRKKLNCDCRTANISAISLDCSYLDNDGEEKTIDIPVTVDYGLAEHDVMALLSENEKAVVYLRLDGEQLTDIRQKRYMDRVQKKVLRFYLGDRGYAG